MLSAIMDNRSAIISFNIDEVDVSSRLMLKIFTEMDDGIGMPQHFKEEAAKALLDRIVAGKEIHLLAIEADYIKSQAPEVVLDIEYYA